MNAIDPPPPTLAPTAGANRLASLDFTRGVAVMGILFANIIGMGQPYLAYAWPGGFASGHGPIDDWLWVAQFTLIDGKMRGLFTLLFGASLALFVDRAVQRGSSAFLQLSRLFWLLVFGLLHYYLLWRGDILTLYALCGVIALVALNWSPIKQFAVGLTAYLVGVIWTCWQLAPVWLANDTARGSLPEYAGIAQATQALLASEKADAAREVAIAAQGNYGAYVAHALGDHRWNWIDLFIYSVGEALPLMLMGMGLYRAGLFSARFDRFNQAFWGWTGVIAGTLLTLGLGLWALGEGLTYTGTLFASVGPQALTRLPVVLGLAALLALWGPGAAGWLGSRVTAAGRVAFTNYVGTSLVTLFVFQGFGLGLFGELGRASLYYVAAVVCVLMLLWSKPWLARFRYGPLEWLWRCLTYRQLFPLRR